MIPSEQDRAKAEQLIREANALDSEALRLVTKAKRLRSQADSRRRLAELIVQPKLDMEVS